MILTKCVSIPMLVVVVFFPSSTNFAPKEEINCNFTFGESPTVNLTCFFPKSIEASKRDLTVYLYKGDQKPTTVLNCMPSGESKDGGCDPGRGFKYDGVLATDRISIQILNASNSLGKYECQVVESGLPPGTCHLTADQLGKKDPTSDRSSDGEIDKRWSATACIALIPIGVVIWLWKRGVFSKCRKCLPRKYSDVQTDGAEDVTETLMEENENTDDPRNIEEQARSAEIVDHFHHGTPTSVSQGIDRINEPKAAEEISSEPAEIQSHGAKGDERQAVTGLSQTQHREGTVVPKDIPDNRVHAIVHNHQEADVESPGIGGHRDLSGSESKDVEEETTVQARSGCTEMGSPTENENAGGRPEGFICVRQSSRSVITDRHNCCQREAESSEADARHRQAFLELSQQLLAATGHSDQRENAIQTQMTRIKRTTERPDGEIIREETEQISVSFTPIKRQEEDVPISHLGVRFPNEENIKQVDINNSNAAVGHTSETVTGRPAVNDHSVRGHDKKERKGLQNPAESEGAYGFGNINREMFNVIVEEDNHTNEKSSDREPEQSPKTPSSAHQESQTLPNAPSIAQIPREMDTAANRKSLRAHPAVTVVNDMTKGRGEDDSQTEAVSSGAENNPRMRNHVQSQPPN